MAGRQRIDRTRQRASRDRETQAQFYLATTANGTDSTAVNVTANAGKLTIEASAFGAIDFATHRYLTAVNSSGAELHYEVELL